jgi:hypothetical protein
MQNSIKTFIGTAPPRLWKHTMIKCGWPVEFVGDVTEIVMGFRWRPDGCAQVFRNPAGV